MSLLTKKQFAAECGFDTKRLAVEIKRGKVVLKDDLINTEHETNRSFLEKRLNKKEDKPQTTPNQPLNPTQPPPPQNLRDEDQDPENLFSIIGIPTYSESERRLKFLDTVKRKQEIEKLKFELSKKRGEVVPSELMKPVFLQHNQSIVTEFKNAVDEVLRIFAKKHSLSVNEVAEITGQLTTNINTAITKATTTTSKSIVNIIKEHTDKKAVGERR
jgi:hypothetical protein